jgi:hypothetical protein
VTAEGSVEDFRTSDVANEIATFFGIDADQVLGQNAASS